MAATNSGVYAKGSLFSTDKDYFFGELTREEAKKELGVTGINCFLLRASKGSLILSLVYNQQFCHIKIKHGPVVQIRSQ